MGGQQVRKTVPTRGVPVRMMNNEVENGRSCNQTSAYNKKDKENKYRHLLSHHFPGRKTRNKHTYTHVHGNKLIGWRTSTDLSPRSQDPTVVIIHNIGVPEANKNRDTRDRKARDRGRKRNRERFIMVMGKTRDGGKTTHMMTRKHLLTNADN